MIGLVKTACAALDQRCLVSGTLNKNGCKIPMQGTPGPHLIVDFDKPGSPLAPNQTRCDYLYVAEDAGGPGWVAPLELQRGCLHATKVVRQLQAGATAAEGFVPSNEPVRFRPFAAYGRSHKAERNKLKRKNSHIRFHGRAEAVRLISCGNPLAQVLFP